MVDTSTENYGFTIISRRKGWAADINNNFSAIDTEIKGARDEAIADNTALNTALSGDISDVQNNIDAFIYKPNPIVTSILGNARYIDGVPIQQNTAYPSIMISLSASGLIRIYTCPAGNPTITWVTAFRDITKVYATRAVAGTTVRHSDSTYMNIPILSAPHVVKWVQVPPGYVAIHQDYSKAYSSTFTTVIAFYSLVVGFTAYGQIFVNGSPRGTLRSATTTIQIFTEDISGIYAGDTIQFVVWNNAVETAKAVMVSDFVVKSTDSVIQLDIDQSGTPVWS